MALARAFTATFAGAPAAQETSAPPSSAPPAASAAPSSAPCLPPHHGCPLCPPNLCKGAALRRLRVERPFARVVYAGDGAGDLCPALSLGPGDVLLARRRHRLAAILDERRAQGLSVGGARIELWDTAEDLRRLVAHATELQLEEDRQTRPAGPLLVAPDAPSPASSTSSFQQPSITPSASLSLPGSCLATQPPSYAASTASEPGSEAPTPKADDARTPADAPLDVQAQRGMVAGRLWA